MTKPKFKKDYHKILQKAQLKLNMSAKTIHYKTGISLNTIQKVLGGETIKQQDLILTVASSLNVQEKELYE